MSSTRVSAARRAADRASKASSGGSTQLEGAVAAASWLADRHIAAPSGTRWYVEIAMDVVGDRPPTDFDETTATRFHLGIYAEEWGVYVCHLGYSSWVRVTDIAFVHGHDDFNLLPTLPALQDIGSLLRAFEQRHRVQFHRQYASVKTNLAGAEPAIRSWIATL